jgi:DHA1 family bicyclomycin/chloramphenicol resistance-like MFS transporter
LLFVVPLSQIPLDLYTPALPQMAIELHTSAEAMQNTVTAYMLGMALSFLPVGAVADARGRKPVLLTCLAVVFATSLVCALAGNVRCCSPRGWCRAPPLAPAWWCPTRSPPIATAAAN